MEKFKEFIWLCIFAVGLWFVYKLFIKQEDDELDITTESTGLSKNDLAIYNEVVIEMEKGGDPYSFLNLLLPLQTSQYAQSAVRLGNLLTEVDNKHLFAQVYAKKRNHLITRDILEIYGEKVYQLVATNVVNFQEFIL